MSSCGITRDASVADLLGDSRRLRRLRHAGRPRRTRPSVSSSRRPSPTPGSGSRPRPTRTASPGSGSPGRRRWPRRGRGFGGEIDAEGALLEPRAALPRPAPTPGSYNCRLIKLGKATRQGHAAFESFKPFFCYVEVEGDLLTIVKQTGSQRPAGRLWEDDRPDRLIFLGSLALGDEQQPLAYGDDPKRDMAGVLERIAPFKWRLVIPWPQSTSKLDVFELTPVAEQPE